MTDQDKLVLAASRLSQTAPAAWDDFLLAFAAYSDSVKDECVSSPLATLPTAQGRAQQAARIHKMLVECRTTSAKIVASQATPRRP